MCNQGIPVIAVSQQKRKKLVKAFLTETLKMTRTSQTSCRRTKGGLKVTAESRSDLLDRIRRQLRVLPENPQARERSQSQITHLFLYRYPTTLNPLSALSSKGN